VEKVSAGVPARLRTAPRTLGEAVGKAEGLCGVDDFELLGLVVGILVEEWLRARKRGSR
jgi:hypothetical protein